MKKLKFYFVFIFIIGCKSLNVSNNKVVKIENLKYKLSYPKSWKVINVKGYSKADSLVIKKSSDFSKKRAVFSIGLDMYSTNLKLLDVIKDLIKSDRILKNSEILEIVKNENQYIEILSKYKFDTVWFKAITRFYKKKDKISKIEFSSKESYFDDFSKYRKLFFGTFVLK